MRFNVITLAFALAAPIMAVRVGPAPGQQGGVLQEFEETTTSAAVAVATPTPTAVAVVNDKGQVQVPNGAKTTTTAASTKAPAAAGASSSSSSKAPNAATPTPVPAPSSSTKGSASATPTAATGGSTGGGGAAPKGGQLLYIVNKYGATLDVVKDKSGGPDAENVPSNIAAGATATISLLPSWAGRFAINPTGVPAGNQEGTKIEGAITTLPFWDISLVDGFTVPITCTCGSDTKPFIGCNIDLFKQAAACPSKNGNALCLNPARPLDNGPSNAWFAPCENAAYTFPKNDIATQTCSGDKMTCCVGAACAAGKNQKSKRELNPVAKRWAIPRSVFDME